MSSFSEILGPVGFIAFLVFLATLINIRFGLVIIIFSIIVSPEIPIYGRPIRFEDVLLTVIILGWLAVLAIQGRKIISTELNLPIVGFMFITLLSMVNSFAFGNIDTTGVPRDYVYSFLQFLKKVEYFLIFFIVVNVVKNLRQIKVYTLLILISCAVATGYGIYQTFAYPAKGGAEVYRVASPFDIGEANTFGQFLLFHISVILSFIFSSYPTLFQRGLLIGLLLACLYSFQFTYSRGAYIALILALLFLGIFKEKKVLLILLGVFVFSAILLPQPVTERIESGKDEIVLYYQEGPGHGTAFEGRVWSFKYGFKKAMDKPLLGWGPGIPLDRIEAQIPREAAECGFLGLIFFIWILYIVFKISWETAHIAKDRFIQALSWGFLAGFFGYLISGFSAIPLTTIRTAEPFWFLFGLVMIANKLCKEQQTVFNFEKAEVFKGKVYKIIPDKS